MRGLADKQTHFFQERIMTSKFVQVGEVLNYAAAADTPVNAIVKAGRLLGVAAVDIKAGTTGSVLLQGVFQVPKASAAVFAQGDTVLFDAANKNFKARLIMPTDTAPLLLWSHGDGWKEWRPAA
jgi:predicted RecA/RadA family phage recombinase